MVVPQPPGIGFSLTRSIAFVFARARIVVAIAVAALALAGGGCGGSRESFTAAEADRALATLDSLENNLADGRCNAADSRVAVLARQAQSVNSERPNLGATFAESVSRLQELVASQCKESKSQPTEPVTGATGEPTAPTGISEPTGGDAPEPQPTGGGVPPTAETPESKPNKPNKPNKPGQGNDESGGVQPG